MDPKTYPENQPNYQPCHSSWSAFYHFPTNNHQSCIHKPALIFNFDRVTMASSPVMMDECFPENIHDDSDFHYDFVYDGPAVGEYDSLLNPKKSTAEYAAAIQLATTPQIINHPYHYHLEAYTHLIKFLETDPATSHFLGSLLNEKLQKMVEFTTARGLVETRIAESSTSHAFIHRPTEVITSSHCPTSRKRKCHRLKIADDYSKKKKHTPMGKEKTR
jgi:hypothetical protein